MRSSPGMASRLCKGIIIWKGEWLTVRLLGLRMLRDRLDRRRMEKRPKVLRINRNTLKRAGNTLQVGLEELVTKLSLKSMPGNCWFNSFGELSLTFLTKTRAFKKNTQVIHCHHYQSRRRKPNKCIFSCYMFICHLPGSNSGTFVWQANV